MSDIIDRLRVAAKTQEWPAPELLSDAADEIERLRERLRHAHDLLQQGLVLSRLGRMIDEARDA